MGIVRNAPVILARLRSDLRKVTEITSNSPDLRSGLSRFWRGPCVLLTDRISAHMSKHKTCEIHIKPPQGLLQGTLRLGCYGRVPSCVGRPSAGLELLLLPSLNRMLETTTTRAA